MTIEQIIETIKIMLGGRKIVGRVVIERNDGQFEVRAFVLNSDGCGKRDTILASFDNADMAISVQRTINFSNGR